MAARVTFDRTVGAKVKKAAAQGLRDAAVHVKKKSQAVVPVDDGEDLKRSATATVNDAELEAQIAYGGRGVSRAYAIHQHEDLALHHDAGKKAKFLEAPLHQEAKTVGKLIAGRVRKALD